MKNPTLRCGNVFLAMLFAINIFNAKAQAPSNFPQFFQQEFVDEMHLLDSTMGAYSPSIGPFPEPESEESKEFYDLFNQRGKFFPFGNFEDARKSDSIIALRLLSSPSCSNGNWKPVGPWGVAANSSLLGKMGRLDCIAINPNNSDVLYVGSGGGGGLWKVTVNTSGSVPTSTAVSMNTDKISLHTGVGCVAVASNRVVVSTGRKHVPVGWNQWEYSCTGVYYTDNEGTSWSKATVADKNNKDPFGFNPDYLQWVSKITVHPNNPNIMYMTVFNIHTIFDSDEKSFGGVYKSIDKGATWNEIDDATFTNRFFMDVEFNPANPDVIYLSGHRLYKSTNGGSTWNDITTLLNGLPSKPSNQGVWYTYQIFLTVPNAGCSITDGNDVVVFVQPGLDASTRSSGLHYDANFLLYHSTDALSSSLSSIMSSTHKDRVQWPTPFHGSVTMTHDPDVLYIAGQIFQRSQNGGQTFATNKAYGSGIHADNQDVAVPIYTGSNAGVLYICTDGGLWRSDDYGDNFVPLNDGLMINQFYGLGVSQTDNTIVAGAQDNYNMRLGNDGIWQSLGSGDGSKSCPINSNDPELYAYNDLQYAGGITYKNRDINNNVVTSSLSITNGNGFSPYKFLNNEPNTLLLATDRMYRVTNGVAVTGDELKDCLGTLSSTWWSGNTASTFDYCYNNPDVIYLSTTGQFRDSYGHITPDNNVDYSDQNGYGVYTLFKSTDGGLTWSDISPHHVGHSGNISSIAVDPNNPDRAWITYGGYATASGGNQNVYITTDGGSSWTNYSNGLPLGSTKDIVYQHGSNDILYLSLGNSIYYRSASMTAWDCYDKNMPITLITDLEISYCTGKLYASTFGRGVWETDLIGYGDAAGFSNAITSNTTWSSSRFLTGSIKVTSGNTLTISGTNTIIRMPRHGTITVEPGAHLIVTDATITNSCENCMWLGIEAVGNSSLSQSGSNQGKVTLTNARIEYARNATMNWPAYSGGGGAKTGGIIQAVNTEFINCRRSVAFNEYYNGVAKNVSFYRQCKFIIGDGYKGDANSPFEEQAALYNVNGVKFYGCEFYNRLNNAQNGLGIAIHIVGGGGEVYNYDPTASSPTHNKFVGFKFGIFSEAASIPMYKTYVDGAIFDSCGIGIRGLNDQNIVTTNNSFSVGRGAYTEISMTECYKNIGIFLTACPNAIVEENTMTGVSISSPPSGFERMGIVIDNSGGNDKQVYRNTMTGLEYGVLAINRNNNGQDRGAAPGLRVICNTFQNNLRDIQASTDQPDIDQAPPLYFGMATFQGSPSLSAGNHFLSSSTSPKHISNFARSIDYYYDYASNSYPSTLQNFPSAPLKNVSVIAVNPTSNTNSCPSRYGGGGYPNTSIGRGGIRADYFTAVAAKQTLESDYAALVDGGDFTMLRDYIDTKILEDSVTVHDTLIALSPWLSREIITYTANAGVMPAHMMKDVTIANPEMIDYDLIALLGPSGGTPYPISADEDLTDLEAAMGTTTARSDMEAEISNQGSEMEYLSNAMLSHLLVDTLCTEADSIPVWYNRINTVKAEYEKIAFYIGKGNFTAAEQAIVQMGTKFTLTTQEQNELALYDRFYNVLKNIRGDGRSILEINEEEIADLVAIQDDAVLINAKQIIYNTKGITEAPGPVFKTICPYFLIASEGKPGTTQQPSDKQKNSQRLGISDRVQAYPNPASDKLTFAYMVAKPMGTLHITLTDGTGKLVQDIRLMQKSGSAHLDTRQFAPGLYIYKLMDGNRTIDVGKVMIVK